MCFKEPMHPETDLVIQIFNPIMLKTEVRLICSMHFFVEVVERIW